MSTMWNNYSFRSSGSSPNTTKTPSTSVEIQVKNLDDEQPPKSPTSTTSPPLSMGWLLRLFRSEFFDAFMAVTYLFRYRASPGVHDYLCNELYKLSDADLETFMPQVCNLLVFHARDSPGLERFVMDKCADSMHMALQVFWFLQAAVEDVSRDPGTKEARVRLLRTRCETAAVNGSRHAMVAAAAKRISAVALVATDVPFQSKKHVPANSLLASSSAGDLTVRGTGLESKKHVPNLKEVVKDVVDSVTEEVVNLSMQNENEESIPKDERKRQREMIDPTADFDPVTLLTMKKERYDYFNDSLTIAREFVNLSLTTRDKPNELRQAHLVEGLERINDILLRRMGGEPGVPFADELDAPSPEDVAKLGVTAALRSIHLPLTRASSQALRILRVNSEEAVILTSRTRAPYLVNIEVLPTNMVCSDRLLFCEQRVRKPQEADKDGNSPESSVASGKKPPRPRGKKWEKHSETGNKESDLGDVDEDSELVELGEGMFLATPVKKISEMTPEERQRAFVRKVVYGDSNSRQPEIFALAEEAFERGKYRINMDSAEEKSKQAAILGVYGELWSWKEERILSKSPFRKLKGTKLMPFIVKAGDDLRQEQLAIQLITQFKKIFDDENVDVFLRPFTVMSVSSEAGFVEVIPDSVSVHSLKKRVPNFVSMLDFFERAFGKIGTRSFRAAQRRFIRSMAGYSLVTYFLQIKDRHNGNIMLDAQGRIIHIDFGFMLTNSPGAIKFENVPFKLTEEYLQVICAKKNVQDLAEASKTEGYRYFQELFVMGLLAARKHYEKITTLVEIMTEGTTMPCMTGGHSIVESLRNRFAVGMPEDQCINFAMGLIEESRLSWRSVGYDRFQAYSNGYR